MLYYIKILIEWAEKIVRTSFYSKKNIIWKIGKTTSFSSNKRKMEIIDFLRYAYLLWSREAKGVIRIDVFSKVAHFLPLMLAKNGGPWKQFWVISKYLSPGRRSCPPRSPTLKGIRFESYRCKIPVWLGKYYSSSLKFFLLHSIRTLPNSWIHATLSRKFYKGQSGNSA